LSLQTFHYPYRPPPGDRHKKDIKNISLYPLINIKLYTSEAKPLCFEGLLDSGADRVFIPKQLAIALRLPKLGEIGTSGIFKSEICYKTKVGFILGRTNTRCIDFGYIEAVFPEAESDIPLLIGRDPLFKYFEINFREYDKKPKVNLIQKKTVNS
jgi:hypothetical protein